MGVFLASRTHASNNGASHENDRNTIVSSKNLPDDCLAQLWTAQHEELASGPIEDLIAHREHRYRISGSTLHAAIDHSSNAPPADSVLSLPEDLSHRHKHGEEITMHPGPVQNGFREKHNSSRRQMEALESEESYTRIHERAGKGSLVDVAEVIRRWTHALQRIHKQALRLSLAEHEFMFCKSDNNLLPCNSINN
eukprot:Gb_23425 [translate_table: standard]